MVWDVFVERCRLPARGQRPDHAKIGAGANRSRDCLRALEKLIGKDDRLAGSKITLADLHAAPMVAYLRIAPEGAELVNEFSRIPE